MAERSDWLRRMQKCNLDQMNVRVHRAVADVDGVTGIGDPAGDCGGRARSTETGPIPRSARCLKSEEAIAKELSGNWRQDHLFNLGQSLKMYDLIEESASPITSAQS